MKLISCQRCGATNRLDKFSLSRIALCGKCQSSLPEPPYILFFRIAVRYKFWLILVVIVFGAFAKNALNSFEFGPVDKKASLVTGGKQRFVPLEEVLPAVSIEQGVQGKFTKDKAIAPLQIITPLSEENYFIKIVDAFSSKVVMTLFVYGGQKFETKVPLGSYRIRYASGVTWYGEDNLFGAQTTFSEADDVFVFSVSESKISGYTIQLIPQLNGNLSTKSINRNQF